MDEAREGLPVHRVPAAAKRRAEEPSLEITGLVEAPGPRDAAALDALPLLDLKNDFRCEEGWTIPDLAWRGLRLSDVLALAKPKGEARFVRVVAGPYVVPLPLEECGSALLATELDGGKLSIEHGGPWRLVVPGGACFTSVKWVERLEVSAEAGEASGEAIAKARLKAK